MKKKIVLVIVLTLVLSAISIIPLSTAHTEEEPAWVPLYAGQTIEVGKVYIWNDEDSVHVEYETTGDWIITETHLYVGKTNPEELTSAPGQFPFYEDPAEDNSYEILFSEICEWELELNNKGKPTGKWVCAGNCGTEPCNDVYIAAHAVVEKEVTCPAIMYGTSLGGSGVGDKIYEIDVTALTATELFDTGLSPSNNINGPNGNAYDSANNRLYYSTYTNPDYLYFYDFTNPVNNPSGTLPGGSVACAGWYNGEYYYIPQNTGNLYKISFNPDGTISSTALVQTYAGKSYNFGDVVINSAGLMYGSSTVNGLGKFWSIDLMNSYLYTEISSMVHMQLAFGSDGTLYGQDAANANFYTIDYVAGTRTLVGTIGGLKFTDLASGPYEPCPPQEETAWGDGDPFGTNWAEYFTYHIQGETEEEWPESGTISIAYEDLPLGGGNDWDYNDFVIDIDTIATFWGSPGDYDLTKIEFTLRPEAKIAGYHHEMHMKFDADTFGGDGSYELYRDSILVASGTYDDTTGLDVIAVPDTNSYPSVIILTIEFDPGVDFSFPTWNPNYYHGEGGNLFFDPYIRVINTGEFVHIGDVRLLTVPVDWQWPTPDGNAIWNVYPKVTAGNPPTFIPNWWTP